MGNRVVESVATSIWDGTQRSFLPSPGIQVGEARLLNFIRESCARLTRSLPLSDVDRSEEHTSELQSLTNLVCRLLLEKKKKTNKATYKGTTKSKGCTRRRARAPATRSSARNDRHRSNRRQQQHEHGEITPTQS